MGRRTNPSRRALRAFSLAAVASLVLVSSAMGQAAIDQYLPSNKPAGHRGSPAEAVREAITPTGPGGPPAQGKAGKKNAPVAGAAAGGPPDTGGGGFPLTAFVLLVLLLFLLGLAVRYLPDLIRRARLRLAS